MMLPRRDTVLAVLAATFLAIITAFAIRGSAHAEECPALSGRYLATPVVAKDGAFVTYCPSTIIRIDSTIQKCRKVTRRLDGTMVGKDCVVVDLTIP